MQMHQLLVVPPDKPGLAPGANRCNTWFGDLVATASRLMRLLQDAANDRFKVCNGVAVLCWKRECCRHKEIKAS